MSIKTSKINDGSELCEFSTTSGSRRRPAAGGMSCGNSEIAFGNILWPPQLQAQLHSAHCSAIHEERDSTSSAKLGFGENALRCRVNESKKGSRELKRFRRHRQNWRHTMPRAWIEKWPARAGRGDEGLENMLASIAYAQLTRVTSTTGEIHFVIWC